MKKIKIAMLSVAIIIAIAGAYGAEYGFTKQSWRTAISTTKGTADPTRDLTPAEKKTCDCTLFQQYYRRNFNDYVEVNGEYGNGYECLWTGQVCTYYKWAPDTHPNSYALCRNGVYWVLE